MSKYVVYYGVRQSMYRDMAIKWKKWSETAGLSKEQLHGVSLFFKSIGRRFGLINEFRDIGVIYE
jgi:hypothetical protein